MNFEIISGPMLKAQKIVAYGPEGVGKTLLAAQAPRPLFIDTEGSTSAYDLKRLTNPTSWMMLIEEVKYVRDKGLNLCNTLVLDTADWAEGLCIDHICATIPHEKGKTITGIEDYGYGKGYTYVGEEFGRLLNILTEIKDAGVNVWINCHSTVRKAELPEEMGAFDRWELKLTKRSFPLVKEWADMLFFLNYKSMVVNVDNQGAAKGKNKIQGNQRVIYTVHHPCWDAKNRYGLPEELPLDYSKIAHCIPVKQTSTTTTPTVKTEPIPVPETPPPASPKTTPIEPMVRYWHSEKARSVVISQTAEEDATFKSDADLKEITKAEYERLKVEYAKPAPVTEALKDDLVGIPKALADLMALENVTVSEIQRAVGSKGYYPADTPISNYDPGFIDGVLIGAWNQVFGMIRELREVEKEFNKEAK